MPEQSKYDYAWRNYNKYADYENQISDPNLNHVFNEVKDHCRTILRFGAGTDKSIHRDYLKHYKQGPDAFKKLAKFAKYLDQISDSPDYDEQLAIFTEACKKFKHSKYPDVALEYDSLFSQMDRENAERYFADNPDAIYAGSANNLMYSYIRSGDKISRRGSTIGAGGFGRTKSGDSGEQSEEQTAIKRQTKRPFSRFTKAEKIQLAAKLIYEKRRELTRQIANGNADDPQVVQLNNFINSFENVSTHYDVIIAEFYWLPKVKEEAKYNLDLGIATTDLLIRRNPDGSIYKVYQDMRNLGPNLASYLKTETLTNQQRFDLAIQLLLKVDELHSGTTSLTNTPVAHGDIKEPNVLVDKNGDLHFIDFGFTKDKDLHDRHKLSRGSPDYMPISFDPSDQHAAYNSLRSLKVVTTDSYLFDDKVAALRTIFHQVFRSGILKEEQYLNLPTHIRGLIHSHSIESMRRNDSTHTLRALSAVFITFNNNPDLCTDDYVNTILASNDLQDRIIHEYSQTREKIRGQDLDGIKSLLLNREIFLEYLPDGYKLNSEIDHLFLGFLLDNRLIESQQIPWLADNIQYFVYKTLADKSWIKSIFNNQEFMDYLLAHKSSSQLNVIFEFVNIYDILTTEEWTYLYVNALLANKDISIVREKADLTSAFYNLANIAIFTDEAASSRALDNLCKAMINQDGGGINLDIDAARGIFSSIDLLPKPEYTSDQYSENTVKLIQQINLACEQCLISLDNLEADRENTNLENVKSLVSLTVQLQVSLRGLESGRISELDFASSINRLTIEYGGVVKQSNPSKDDFNLKEDLIKSQERYSPISVTNFGMFKSEINSDSDEYNKIADNKDINDTKFSNK